jgi:hypothetical protein
MKRTWPGSAPAAAISQITSGQDRTRTKIADQEQAKNSRGSGRIQRRTGTGQKRSKTKFFIETQPIFTLKIKRSPSYLSFDYYNKK